MANLYTTEAAIQARVSADRLTSLLDRDLDGTADEGVLTAAIERAGRIINRSLRQRYGSSVPFAQITDDPATPEEIQKIADDLVLFDLFSYYEPGGRDAEYYRALAFEALEALRDGTEDIRVARAKGNEGYIVAVYDAEAPVFAGVNANDVSRLRGV